MNHTVHLAADELIRTLGELGLEQEKTPDSVEVAELTRQAHMLRESLVQAFHDR